MLVASFFLLGYTYAQITITGTILDEATKEPVIGANVVEKGTTNGTTTDFDGNYTITVAGKNSELIFSYVSYVNQTVKVGEQKKISLSLKEDRVEIDEFVKIGYAVAKKEDVTSSITSLKDDDIKNRPVLGVDQALQGKAAGVSVKANSGTPGGEMEVNIRGVASLRNSKPLYVIDGVPSEDIGGLNNSDVATISILKDASACAIYGARGANGVIIISTKSGREGGGKATEKINVDFSAYRGTQKAWKKVDVMNAEEYMSYYNELNDTVAYTLVNDTIYFNGVSQNVDSKGTDWQDEVFRDAVIENYQLSISGGSEKSNFASSISWFNQEGVVKTTDFQRLTARVRGDHKIGKRIRFGEQIGFNQARQSVVSQGSEWDNVLSYALVANPTLPVYDKERFYDSTLYLYNQRNPKAYSYSVVRNPVTVLDEHSDKNTTYGLGGNFYVEVDLFKGLTYRSQFSMSLWDEKRYRYSNEYYLAPDFQSSRRLEERYISGHNSNTTHQLSYNKLFYAKKDGVRDSTKIVHSLNAVIATEKYQTYDKSFTVWGENLYSEDENLREPWIARGSRYERQSWQGVNTWTMASYLGRVEYGLLNRYNFNVSVRRDGSSKFGPENKWQSFPSLGFAWKIHNEKFFKNSEALKFISECKLRYGWGKIGNAAAADSYGWASLMATSQTEAYYNFNNKVVTGATPRTLANTAVHWEAAKTTNIGMDFQFFKGKILFSADWFTRLTTDMLLEDPIPLTSGFLENPIVNLGEMKNSGYEFNLGYQKKEGEFHYNINGNISFVENQLAYMGQTGIEPNIQSAGQIAARETKVVRNAELQDVGAFYGFKVDEENPIYETWADINNGPKPLSSTVAPGDLRFVDINNDGLINDDDKTYIGSPLPDFTYGFSFGADYKGIDLSLSLTGSQGNDLFNAMKFFTDNNANGYNQSIRRLEAWTEDNTGSDIPRNSLTNTNYNTVSSWWIEDGSFLRLKDITLGYTLPDKLVSKLKMSKLRVYIQAQNLLTFTKYSGYDPEIGNNPEQGFDSQGNKGFELGIDRGAYPQAKAFILGLNLSF
ncbi:MAG: TonB-dependent receptor [Bacteroidales bacterium]|nr:TonB-dependent receptor [Bacteroidales bacterium]